MQIESPFSYSFNGEVFERCHCRSEWELALPSNLLAEHSTLSYELISDYHKPLPYAFYEVEIIEQPAAELTILSLSHAAPTGGKARVLIRTERSDLYVTFVSKCDSLWVRRSGCSASVDSTVCSWIAESFAPTHPSVMSRIAITPLN